MSFGDSILQTASIARWVLLLRVQLCTQSFLLLPELGRELVAGYWIWQCKSLDEAIEWLKRCPNPMPGESEIEIRQIFELDDFDNLPDEVRKTEERFHQQK